MSENKNGEPEGIAVEGSLLLFVPLATGICTWLFSVESFNVVAGCSWRQLAINHH
jgi:hypothetical protein